MNASSEMTDVHVVDGRHETAHIRVVPVGESHRRRAVVVDHEGVVVPGLHTDYLPVCSPMESAEAVRRLIRERSGSSVLTAADHRVTDAGWATGYARGTLLMSREQYSHALSTLVRGGHAVGLASLLACQPGAARSTVVGTVLEGPFCELRLGPHAVSVLDLRTQVTHPLDDSVARGVLDGLRGFAYPAPRAHDATVHIRARASRGEAGGDLLAAVSASRELVDAPLRGTAWRGDGMRAFPSRRGSLRLVHSTHGCAGIWSVWDVARGIGLLAAGPDPRKVMLTGSRRAVACDLVRADLQDVGRTIDRWFWLDGMRQVLRIGPVTIAIDHRRFSWASVAAVDQWGRTLATLGDVSGRYDSFVEQVVRMVSDLLTAEWSS